MSKGIRQFERWPPGPVGTGGRVGTPTDQVLAETWLKGLRDFDVESAFSTSLRAATEPGVRAGIGEVLERGDVAWEDANAPAALTPEYAWSDHALCQWGSAMGHDDEAALPCANASAWANIWGASTGFFRGRHADGTFDAVFDSDIWANDFVEGTVWQCRAMVPYDVEELLDVQNQGDRTAFLDELDEFWALSASVADSALPDPYYWHGNEPDIHAAYLASLAGDPARTAEAVRWVRGHKYRTTPDGLDGNDDGGTLSAWLLWSAIGTYPIAGTDRYAVGSPWFERAEIDRPEGTWTIDAPGASDEAQVAEETRVSGKDVTGSFTHAQWAADGTIAFTMGR